MRRKEEGLTREGGEVERLPCEGGSSVRGKGGGATGRGKGSLRC